MKNYSNKEYYEKSISDPAKQFDLIETTISHLFRFPHPALQGLSYGAAFCKQVLERKLLTNEHKIIVEVANLNDSRALNNADPAFPVAAIPASLLYQAFGLDVRSTAGLRLPKVGAEGFPDDNTLPFYQSFQTLVLKK